MKYRINYSKVKSQADSIKENASQLFEQEKLLSQLEQECRSVWEGNAANTFSNRLHLLHDNIYKTARQMTELAYTINYCAAKIEQEDTEAAEKAATLKSNY